MKIKIIGAVIIDGRVVAPDSKEAAKIEADDMEETAAKNLIRIGCAEEITEDDPMDMPRLIHAVDLAIKAGLVTGRTGAPTVEAMGQFLGVSVTSAQRDAGFAAWKKSKED